MKNREARNQHIYARAFRLSCVVGSDMGSSYYDSGKMSTVNNKGGM